MDAKDRAFVLIIKAVDIKTTLKMTDIQRGTSDEFIAFWFSFGGEDCWILFFSF